MSEPKSGDVVEWLHVFPAHLRATTVRRRGVAWCGIPGRVSGTKTALWVVPDETEGFDFGSAVAVAQLTSWRTYARCFGSAQVQPGDLTPGDWFADNDGTRGLGLVSLSAAQAAVRNRAPS